jgi:hypothetical protein
MSAIAQHDWQELEDDPEIRLDGRVDPRLEDAYWQSMYWGESYYRAELTYDDYAPAYCVGYIGYAQYGGCCDEAEKSLCANWLRIKGDSRLVLDEALQAIRAAWKHAARGQVAEEEAEYVQYDAVAARQVAPQPEYAAA